MPLLILTDAEWFISLLAAGAVLLVGWIALLRWVRTFQPKDDDDEKFPPAM